MLVLLNGLISFCHYCLISTTTGGTLSSTAGRVSSKHHKNSVDETSSLFLNLVQVFSGGATTTPAKVTTSEEGKQGRAKCLISAKFFKPHGNKHAHAISELNIESIHL